MKGPTISDVARRAGVSIASVSRVLNNVEPISDETKHKVEEAARDLGYSQRRSSAPAAGTAAVVIPDPRNSYFLEIVTAIEDVLQGRGFLISVMTARSGVDFPARFFRWAERTRCDGLIVISAADCLSDSDIAAYHDRTGRPVVTVNREPTHPQIPNIKVNFSEAMYAAARHLINLNHRRFAFLAGPPWSLSMHEKKAGLLRALNESNLSIDERFWISGEPTIEGGFQSMNRILETATDSRPTGVISFNDLQALGAIHAIRAARLKIPEDISVIGFDDIDMAAHTNPPLTTVSPPKRTMGETAAQMLYNMLKGSDLRLDHYTVMESPIIVRESTGFCK